MSNDASKPQLERRLISRPQTVVAAEQKRHDRAQARALTSVLAALFVGGGLAFFIQSSAMFRGRNTLQAILECIVFVLPVSLSFVALCRVPPPPFESLNDARHDIDKKVKEWRAILALNVLIFGMVAVENIWIWPRVVHLPNWIVALFSFFPMLCMIFVAIYSLYMQAGWLNPDLRASLDDEVTWSFRARAQRLGYLLMLFIVLGFSVLARIDPGSAAYYLPLGLAAGIALPVLYFVYLDWQASRSG